MNRLLLPGLFLAALAAVGLLAPPSLAAPKIEAPKGLDDAVVRAILSGSPLPADVFGVRRALLKRGGKLRTHLLANKGNHNPSAGSFTFFETYSGPMDKGTVKEGELFFGFFTTENNGVLQVRTGDPLRLELIAWDYKKKAFNFWELIEKDDGEIQWHHAGDSNDVLQDVAEVNLGLAKPKLGKAVRCSGCHTLGALVMKELPAPHNDWALKTRSLPLGTIKLNKGKDADAATRLAAELFPNAADAGDFSSLVKKGIDRLLEARAGGAGRSQTIKQQLRSLFTTMEMNLMTDRVPYTERLRKKQAVELPAEFFVDTRLTGGGEPVSVPIDVYAKALNKLDSAFAGMERGLVESHHAFSVPVRSWIDNRVLDSLIKQKLLSEEMVVSVLAIDFTTPVYSATRAGLICYVPDTARDAGELRKGLVAALEKAKGDRAAKELLANLTDAKRDRAFHRKAALAYLQACRKANASVEVVEGWLRLAAQRRKEIASAQTALFEGGNVVEEGFKVLFPDGSFDARPGRWRLDPKTARLLKQNAGGEGR